MNKPKPCPFCNGEAEVVRVTQGYTLNPITITNAFVVRCKECKMSTKSFESEIWQGSNGIVVIEKNGAVDAIDFWNRRASDDSNQRF